MIQLKSVRLQAANSLILGANMNRIKLNDETECGAISADDLGKDLWLLISGFRGGGG